eukprot:gene32055-38761_t
MVIVEGTDALRLVIFIRENVEETTYQFSQLFILPKATLHCPPRGHDIYTLKTAKRRKEMRNFLFTNIKAWSSGGTSLRQLLHTKPSPPPGSQQGAPPSRAQNLLRCRKLVVEEGMFSKAVQALESNGLAAVTPETIQCLVDKHPRGAIPECRPPPESAVAFTVDRATTLECLRSFPRDTACGRSGLRVSHLLNFLASEDDDNHPGADALTSVLSAIASGQGPAGFAPFFASAPLVPLKKKDDSIRPIAVGEVLRRLLSKIALKDVISKETVPRYLLQGGQMGVGTPYGAEAIIMGMNRLIQQQSLPQSTSVALIDFSNAFNCVERSCIIDEVFQHCPSLAAYVQYTYCCPA